MSEWQTTASRRELLVAMLGAPIAMQACRQRAPELNFRGQIVGQDVAHAHLLREPARIAALAWNNVTPVRKKVIIVGSGPSGLTAAWRLSKAQQQSYMVLELEPQLGGTSTAGSNSVSAFPWGAHYVPAPARENQRLIELLRAMDLEDPSRTTEQSFGIREEVLVRDLDERVWVNGRWQENLIPTEGLTTKDRQDIAAFQREIDALVEFRDARSRPAFALPVERSSDAPRMLALDELTMDQWLASKQLSAPRLKWLINYACRDDYGLTSAQTSAWAGLFYFASRQDAAHTTARELLAFPEGNGKFTQWFFSQIPRENTRTSTLVVSVKRRADGLIETRAIDLLNNSPLRWLSDSVLMATPHFVAKRIVEEPSPTPHPLDGIQHSPWMVANLTLRERPARDDSGLEMAWDNVLYDSPSLGYVCATHQSMRDYGPTVLTWYLPFVSENPAQDRHKLFAMSYQDCAQVVMADLVRVHPDLPKLVTELNVMRWGHAMVRPSVGTRRRVIAAEGPQFVQGPIFYAHTERSGVALFEEAFNQGWNAAERILRVLTAPSIESPAKG